MMQQLAMTRPRPFVVVTISRGVRWGALAVAGIAVPASIVLAALVQAPATSVLVLAPVVAAAVEVTSIAPITEPAPASGAPSSLLSGDSAPASPAYTFIWSDECESSCPGRGEF